MYTKIYDHWKWNIFVKRVLSEILYYISVKKMMNKSTKFLSMHTQKSLFKHLVEIFL